MSPPRLAPTPLPRTHAAHPIFGVPFDATTLDDMTALILHAARSQQRLFLSTVNVNFLVTAQRDAAFRQALLRSDRCTADGWPIVWLARLMRLPLRERVSGADIFERLRAGDPDRALKIYFFGGAEGVAERASALLNARPQGLRCVGHAAPGFGSLDEMSTPTVLERINASGADLLIVSIGAQRGQAWIERNRYALSVPVISYFGAVVNFAAGEVQRAPRWMQRGGLEWLWRIGVEPSLWRRYAADGLELTRLTWRHVVLRRPWTP
jgi:N-acetylglucosaminyldiphosphoundecaprenol N-acetyl-beta-D-mannosaminyltransferase